MNRRKGLIRMICIGLFAVMSLASVSCHGGGGRKKKELPEDTTKYTRHLGLSDFAETSGWSEESGVIIYNGEDLSALQIKAPFNQKQIIYSFDVELGKGSSAGLSFRSESSDSDKRTAFVLDNKEQKASVSMREYTDMVNYGQGLSIENDTPYRIKIILNGSYGEFYLDGELLYKRCDIAQGNDYMAFLARGSVRISNIALSDDPMAPESWEQLLLDASQSRAGWDRFNSTKFEYYHAGIGKTNLYVGVDGFTSPASYANRPKDIDDYFFDPMLVYDYWWDGTTRLAPFALDGGYLYKGKVYSGANGQNWSQSLDLSTGTVTTELETAAGDKKVQSTRSVFVTEDGTVCYAISSNTDLPFVFTISGRQEGYKVYQYEYPEIVEGQYNVSCKLSDDMLLFSTELATDKQNKAYVAVKAVCNDGTVSYDEKQGSVTIKAKKDKTFYLFISPASDLAPEGNDSGTRVKTAAGKTYDGNLNEVSAWWADFWSKGQISIPDKGLAIWYIRSQYEQAAALATARVPAGCFSTNIDGFFGNICFEYDMMFSVTSLQRTNHLEITGNIENWIRTYYAHSCELAQNGDIFGNVHGASVLCGLMGYDCTPCESWSLRENWHATHGGMNLTSFLFRNAKYGNGDDSFARTVLESQIKMMETAFYYDTKAGGYRHTGIWSPQEKKFFNMVSGDALQAEAAYWALQMAAQLGIEAWSPDSIYRNGFHGPNQGSPALLSYYWQPAREIDESLLILLDSVLGGSSFSYHFNRGLAAALCARAGLGELAEQTVLSMIDTSAVLYDDTYMCESTYNQSDYKRAPELGAHGALVDALSLMLLDAEDEGVLKFFSAVPESYVEAGCSFTRYAAPGNIEVSGSLSKEKTEITVTNRGNADQNRTLYIRVPSGSSGVSEGTITEGRFAKIEIIVPAGETVSLTVTGSGGNTITPEKVTPLFPDNGQMGIDRMNASFCFTKSSNTDRYLLVISENADLSDPAISETIIGDNLVRGVVLPYRRYQTQYHWCVYSTDATGEIRIPMDGGIRSFTTDGETKDNLVCGIEFDSHGGVELNASYILLDISPSSPYGANVAFFELEQQDNFTISFKISDYYPDTDHQQIGLYIAETSDITNVAENWGKFMRVYSSGNAFEYYGTEESWSGGGRANDNFKSDSVYMKLEAKDGYFTFYVSEDGSSWKRLGKCKRSFTDEISIGFAGATYSVAEASAKIEEIVISYE